MRVGASDEMKVIFLHAAANAETFWFWLALAALRTKGLPRLDTTECETQWSWEEKSAKHTKDPDMLELCLACAAGSEGFAEYIGCTMVHQEWRDDERIKLIRPPYSAKFLQGKSPVFIHFFGKKTKSPCSRGEIFYGKSIRIKT